jgi:hypothetical protein
MTVTYLIIAVLGAPAMTRYRIVAGRPNTARLMLNPAAARRFLTREGEQE